MKSNKILIVFAVLLLFSNYLTYSAIDRLENRVSNLNNTVSRLSNDMNNISGQVSRSLNEFISENSWIGISEVRAGHYKEETMTVEVDVKVEFNELENEESVYIVVQDTEGNVMDKIDVTEDLKSSLNLNRTLDLSIDYDYELSILGESVESKRSDKLDSLYIMSRIQQMFYVDGHGWEAEYDEEGNYKTVKMDIMINSAFQKEQFIADYFKDRKIVDAKGEIFVDDELFDTIDLLNDEDWEIYQDGYSSDVKEEKVEREIPAMEEGAVPLFEFTGAKEYFVDLSGTYSFEEYVNPQQKVQMYVVFKDNQGNEYRHPIYGIFDYEG
jgi:outer membrane murein-binding lipoprotein Lpp